jgi:periplasmic protein TonB
MLKNLLESSAKKDRNDAITAASVTVHVVLIIVAAFATAAGASSESEPEDPTRIIWTQPPPRPQGTVHPIRLSTAPSTNVSLANVAVSIDVPTSMPAVNLPLGAIIADDFAPSSGPSSNTGNDSGISGPSDGGRAYTASEVEVPVAALGGARPEYPAALRSSGMEGQVVAQFIVDETGGVLIESVTIVSATNSLFGESVRRTIPKMRFTAARIGSRPVPQLVQQLFVFRLDR